MDNPEIVASVRLQPTRKYIRKTVHKVGSEVLPAPSFLKIAHYLDDDGFYLFYYNSDGVEIADTYHSSIVEAMRQAEFEFGIVPDEWKAVR